MTERQKKRGRPGPKPRGPFVGKRTTFTTRITENTRLLLNASAEEADRSISQEAEFRLVQSYLWDELLGGPGNATAAKLIGPILQDVEVLTGKSWREDKDTYYGAFAAVATVMRMLGPQDVPQPEITFDEDADADEHVVFGAIKAARKLATGGKRRGK